MAYSTITKSSNFFNAKLYTGNGSSLAVDTGIDLTANGALCIAKNRNASNKDWYWVDTVRGANKTIHSNGTGSEQNYTTGITGFNNNGFQVGSATQTNGSGNSLVGYNFKAGTSVTGASNTDGDVTSTITANTTSGFSIVRWTGTAGNISVGHGMSKIPKAILIKNLSNGSAQWVVYHVSTGNTKALYLNTTTAPTTTAGFFYNTTPTSSTFKVGTDTAVNGSGNSMLAYCFADVTGYSKFGNFICNGNDNNSFIYTGMKPQFIMMKPLANDGWSKWYVFDTARSPENMNVKEMEANTANVESGNGADYAQIDMLSNGFKIRRGSSWGLGSNNQESIYLAFGQPLVSGTGGGVPCTAR